MQKKQKSPELKRLLEYIGKHKPMIALAFISTAAAALIGVANSEILRRIVNAAQQSDISSIKTLVIAAAVLLPFIIISQYVSEVSAAKFSNAVLRTIKDDSIKHVAKLPVEYLDHNKTGEIMSKLSNDTNTIQGFLQDGFTFMLFMPFMILFYAAYMLYLSPILFVASFITFPVLLTIGFHMSTVFKAGSRKYMAFMGKLNNSISDMIGGISIVKSFCIEQFLNTDYEKKLESATNQAKTNEKNMAIGGMALDLARNIATISCLIVGGYLAIKGRMELGSLVAFYSILGMSLHPITYIGFLMFNSKAALAASERVFTVLDYPIEHSGSYNGKNFDAKKVPVAKFEHVAFEYNENVPVVNDLSFEIYEGQTVAIVGPSGGGKTSVLNMLCGFYRPKSGSISFMGKNIDDWDINAMRDKIAYVSQTSYLFPITIADNIALGRDGSEREEIINAAKLAYADDFINEAANGYDTVVEERGGNFSGGQNQRMSIARAFLKNAPVLLLDEATASLDKQSELQVQQAVENLSKNRTVIVVAHRLSTIQNADVILVLDKGKIQEQGTHSELLEKNGLYARLYSAALTQEEAV